MHTLPTHYEQYEKRLRGRHSLRQASGESA